MGQAIAIVGMACRYPDARSPDELWENALAQRRAFRRIPAERLNLNDYLSPDRQSPDRTYSTEGAFIEGYEFDRTRFRIPGATYRAADPAHWLTLDVAACALEDAGFPEGEGLPREATGVFVGNTLTGEFSRANTMRLRWPYVRRVVKKILEDDACPPERQHELLAQMETLYKQPFPPVGAETLAGGLSNTIAGRICNHFDLKGGGYTVDGACASSLLAVINACTSLAVGDLEVAIAGGVDLSTDPFELVGFAKTGALAADTMRVYDARSAGFWPGEGCGLIVLMRHEDALLKRRRVYAVIRGWGISSDGSGGITRPEVEGQFIALRRAYARAGYGADTVAYFEGHGTGTAVGDAAELKALAQARRGANATPAVVSSVKAIIGHTKAAAGVAGLIKATMALGAQILPPTVGCDEPHEELKGDESSLRALKQGELFSTSASLRAGVSAMGFGGINTHLTLEAPRDDRRQSLTTKERALLTSAQDAELFLFSAPNIDQLENQIERLLVYAERLSRSELTDLAVRLSETLRPLAVRAAVVASSAAELSGRLEALRLHARSGVARLIDPQGGLFFTGVNGEQSSARIGFLFPGQGSPTYKDGGAWRRRFNFLEDLYAYTKQEWRGDGVSTEVAQPAIVASSVAALRVLSRLRMTAAVAVGHSLGEFTALHWAGSLDESSLLRIARARGRAMAECDGPAGAMLSVAADRQAVEQILNGERVVIAGLNSPMQTVLSGEAIEINAVARRAEARGLHTTLLRVSHAFHSSLVASAGTHLYAHLEREKFGPLKHRVCSTVTGLHLGPDDDLRALLREQVTSPVRFMEAVDAAVAEGVDLWLEVGPGQTLCGLIGQFRNEPAIALDAGGTSIRGLLSAVAACFCLGARIAHDELFANRFARPFDLDWHPRFFVNPCELAPPDDAFADASLEQSNKVRTPDEVLVRSHTDTPLEVVRRLVAERLELPIATIEDKSRLLDDLHLNSISVAQLVAEAARHLNLPPPPAPTHYANATLSEIASALEAAARARGPNDNSDANPTGVDEWVREFSVEFVERALPRREGPSEAGDWRILAPPDHPLKFAVEKFFSRADAGRGIVVLLAPEPDESHISLLLEGAREALKCGDNFRFVLVQYAGHAGGAASFTRTLHLEAKNLNTCVVEVPMDHPEAAAWVLAEALAARGYTEAHYSSDGKRCEPVLRPLEPEPHEADACELPLTANDVLVVTGGARGITAECALRLARESGVRLAIFGLSQSTADDEIVSNLERMEAAGIHFRYYSVDVTDAVATREAVREVERDLGPVTGILHGAARNIPCLIENLNSKAFSETLAPKIHGAQNLLAAINPDRLHLFITFSSIIARTGLPGEAHYGLANEWLTHLTEHWQTAHSHCCCLAIEWSVWSGVGMGARLGTVDELARRGITPIPIEKGLDALRRLLCRRSAKVAAVVMGRLRDLPTLKIERPELPFLRFLEKPRVYYPKIELVVDAELSTATDPYLDDHIFRGERLLPAVMGMEAMAQVFMALTETNEPPAFEQVKFERPVVIHDGAGQTIRVAALVRAPGCVEIVLRSSETSFQVDHFRAVCRVGNALSEPPRRTVGEIDTHVCVDPEHDLYGRVLFHSGRFRRLREYRALKATECAAEIMPDGTTSWFGRYLPGALVLGDPGARDAAIHAVQACVPQITLLPVAVKRITGSLNAPVGGLFVRAHERARFANGFVYDVELSDAEGCVRERWERLHLRAVSGTDFKGPWPEGLLTPYVERCLLELVPGARVSVAFERDTESGRHDRSTRAIERALGVSGIIRRADGKPEARDGRDVSASHSGDLTMAVAGHSPVGCDLELVVTRPLEIWCDMLGVERFKLAEIISQEAQETLDVAATRVWTSAECLKKAGAGMAAPLVFASTAPNGWVLLVSGELKIASGVIKTDSEKNELAIALLTGDRDARV